MAKPCPSSHPFTCLYNNSAAQFIHTNPSPTPILQKKPLSFYLFLLSVLIVVVCERAHLQLQLDPPGVSSLTFTELCTYRFFQWAADRDAAHTSTESYRCLLSV